MIEYASGALESGGNTTGRPRLVLVDDRGIRTSVLALAFQCSGFEVAIFASADDGLAACLAQQPELVIANFQQSDRSGLELCEAIIELELNADAVVVVFGDDIEPVDKLLALELGINEVWREPIYIAEFVRKTKSAMGHVFRSWAVLPESTGFRGGLADHPVSDIVRLLSTQSRPAIIEVRRTVPDSAKIESGVLYVGKHGLRHVQVEDHLGRVGFYRAMSWTEGEYKVSFEDFSCPDTIDYDLDILLLEGLLLIDAGVVWSEELSSFRAPLSINLDSLGGRLGDLPDSANSILRFVDGRRTIGEISDLVELADSEYICLINSLLTSGVLVREEVRQEKKDLVEPTFGTRRRGNTEKNFPTPLVPRKTESTVGNETVGKPASRGDGRRADRSTPVWEGPLKRPQGQSKIPASIKKTKQENVSRKKISGAGKRSPSETLPPSAEPTLPAKGSYDAPESSPEGSVSQGKVERRASKDTKGGQGTRLSRRESSSGYGNLGTEESPLSLIARANAPADDRLSPVGEDSAKADEAGEVPKALAGPKGRKEKRGNWSLATAAAVLLAGALGLTALAIPSSRPPELVDVEEAISQGDPEKALALLSRISEPTVRGRNLKVELLYQVGEEEQALEMADQVLEQYPASSRAWLTKGLIFFGRGQKLRASAALRRYLVLEPNAANTHDVRILLESFE